MPNFATANTRSVMSIDSSRRHCPRRSRPSTAFVTADTVDLPTLALAGATYIGFGLVTWFHHALPWWVIMPLGGYFVALHGSLQHEAVHGYPFGSALGNRRQRSIPRSGSGCRSQSIATVI